MIQDNVVHARECIARACARCGRSPDEVTLIAVTKMFGIEVIREVMAAGVSDIGENFVQEFAQKYNEIGGENVRWHFIGHLQRNKVKDVVGRVCLVHSVDSYRLAEALSKRAEAIQERVDILLEVNTSAEETKFGVTPGETAALAKSVATLPGIRLQGLMTIGPFLPDPEGSRPAFRTLRTVRDQIAAEGIPLPILSMGMSNDFEVAIEEGSTMVRIGTALFGKRVYA